VSEPVPSVNLRPPQWYVRGLREWLGNVTKPSLPNIGVDRISGKVERLAQEPQDLGDAHG
jgi:hypothetical protein